MKTKALTFISLLLIATMIGAPLIYAIEGGFYSPVTDWSGGSSSDYSGGWSGGGFAGYDSSGWSGGGFAGYDPSGWSGGSSSEYSAGWSGGSFSSYDSSGWSGGSSTPGESTPSTDTTPSAPTSEPANEPGGGIPPGGPIEFPPGGTPPPGEPVPTNVDAKWQDLPDATIYQGSPSGTIIQKEVFSKCSDPDDANLEFKITSKSDNFELSFVKNDLGIFKLNPAYVGRERITITCNNVPEYFNLNVIERPTTPPTPKPKQPTTSEEDGISVHISTIRIQDTAAAGELVPITLTFKNNGNEKLENLKATIVIQELGIRASVGPMDLTTGKKASKTIYVELPEDVQPGTYYAKIMIDSGSIHRIKYRDIEIS